MDRGHLDPILTLSRPFSVLGNGFVLKETSSRKLCALRPRTGKRLGTAGDWRESYPWGPYRFFLPFLRNGKNGSGYDGSRIAATALPLGPPSRARGMMIPPSATRQRRLSLLRLVVDAWAPATGLGGAVRARKRWHEGMQSTVLGPSGERRARAASGDCESNNEPPGLWRRSGGLDGLCLASQVCRSCCRATAGRSREDRHPISVARSVRSGKRPKGSAKEGPGPAGRDTHYECQH